MRIALASIVLAAPFALMPAAQARETAQPYAHSAIQQGDFETAERKLIAEARIFPERPEVLLNLAAVYAKTGRYAEARDLYAKVLSDKPVAMDVADGQVAPSHLVAKRGLRLIDNSRQASR